MSQKTPQVLLIEDNPADVLLTQEAMAESSMRCDLHVARDAETAMAILGHENGYEDTPRPDLILLDLNLPRRNGRDLLEDMKSDDRFSDIPVVVLTTSNSPQDINQTYRAHANAYLIKPVDIDTFITVIDSLQDFWFKTVTLPVKETTP